MVRCTNTCHGNAGDDATTRAADFTHTDMDMLPSLADLLGTVGSPALSPALQPPAPASSAGRPGPGGSFVARPRLQLWGGGGGCGGGDLLVDSGGGSFGRRHSSAPRKAPLPAAREIRTPRRLNSPPQTRSRRPATVRSVPKAVRPESRRGACAGCFWGRATSRRPRAATPPRPGQSRRGRARPWRSRTGAPIRPAFFPPPRLLPPTPPSFPRLAFFP